LPFTSQIFDLDEAWNSIDGLGDLYAYREAVARGEALFDNPPITVTGVARINDLPGPTTVSGFCGTCHDTPDVGNHSVKLPINIGIANGGANNNNPSTSLPAVMRVRAEWRQDLHRHRSGSGADFTLATRSFARV
jgi:cytochrome c peroxidase